MIFTGSHGGECCGITNIYNFPVYSEEARLDVERQINSICRNRPSGLIEIVLIDRQLGPAGGWAAAIEDFGFVLVSRFLNSNHGNWCNVFHLKYGQPWGRLRNPQGFAQRKITLNKQCN